MRSRSRGGWAAQPGPDPPPSAPSRATPSTQTVGTPRSGSGTSGSGGSRSSRNVVVIVSARPGRSHARSITGAGVVGGEEHRAAGDLGVGQQPHSTAVTTA